MFLVNKNVLYIVSSLGIAATYCYRKHMYEKALFTRMNYLLQNNTKLSGVYLQQRQPFGFLWFIQWLLPYHQSLKIIQKDGNIRHVGLGRSPVHKSFFDFTSEFILHKGGSYDKLNKYEISFPVEAWVDYKKKYGHFPENINVNELNKITMTREEAIEDSSRIYKTTCGKPITDENGDFVITSCRSAVMYAIHEEELRRIKQQTINIES